MNKKLGSTEGQSGEEIVTPQHRIYSESSMSVLEYAIPHQGKNWRFLYLWAIYVSHILSGNFLIAEYKGETA